ncbi:MAG TPA: ABC transporter permease [Acidobacteriaceae bacterium]|nr:ABC transporter permease [Acidobacteriaceae bacterium]
MSFLRRLWALTKRDQMDREIDEELHSHLEMRTEDNMAEGMTPDRALRAARLRFGNPVAMKERVHAVHAALAIESVLADIRYAIRGFLKKPGFAAMAILSLALGIGVNTAIFSLVDSILLKPLPVPNPEQITTLVNRDSNGPLGQYFSWPEIEAIRSQSGRSFSSVFGYSLSLDGLAVPSQQPQRVFASYVSGNFFSGLGLKPAVGRLFLPGEGEVQGSRPEIVLTYDYWKQKFNGDPNAVGRTVTVNGHATTIVGVTPKGFSGLQNGVSVAAYLPVSEDTITGTPTTVLNIWQYRVFRVFGRLRSGVELKQANAELSVVAHEMMRQHPDVEKKLSIAVYPESALRVSSGNAKSVYTIAALFLSLALMVLLLACVNLANLVLVRATAREREMAVRAALGAQRLRLIRQTITESVTLALVGGVSGVILGLWASSLVDGLNVLGFPLTFSLDFDWRIFLYSFSIALLAGVAVGFVPALRVMKTNANTLLHKGGRGVTDGRHRLRDGLVAMQLASSLVMLVVAALFVRSLSAVQTMDFGFNPNQVMNFTVDASEIGMTSAQARDLAGNILERLQRLPGVEYASHAISVPMSSTTSNDELSIDGQPAPVNSSDQEAGLNVVTPDYFKVMGIGILRGRAFTGADDEDGRLVAIVSESTAKKFWPGQDALGRTFHRNGGKGGDLEVLGIARDAEFQFFAGKTKPFFYVPYAQNIAGTTLMTFQIRAKADPAVLAPEIERTVHALAPDLPVFQVQTMREALYTFSGLLTFQIGAVLAAIMGALGLTLAVIGLYGVVSYSVSRRVHEIGLRMALGATRGAVLQMIYRQSLLIIGWGLGIGLAMALLAARAVGRFVVVSVWDPATYVVVAAALALVALGSCYLPVRRAMAVEPTVALREE